MNCSSCRARRGRRSSLRYGAKMLRSRCSLKHCLVSAQQSSVTHFFEGAAFSAITEPPLAGRTIGAYTLERPLGEGGMGTVWLGRRSDGRYEGKRGRQVPQPSALLGSRRRRALCARRQHAGAPDASEHRAPARCRSRQRPMGGQPYLVLEYIDGVPIDRWCDATRCRSIARLRLFLDVLARGRHAHSNLVLHRDLKPSNILVTRERRGEAARLRHRQAARRADRRGGLTDRADAAGGRAFTPEYAAPEQVQGGDVTTATDVYALGVLLYVLLAGVHPTARPAKAPMERLRSVIETEPASALRSGGRGRRGAQRRGGGARRDAARSSAARCAATSTTSARRR